jgi:diguanylate cyclase (GGDEF)-like protein
MFDLDHFKQVNDRYGHAGGDAVLRGVGQLCIGSFRGVDMAARVGGEEFAVLLPGASAQQAGAVMERFLHTLGGLDMDIGPHNVRVTATAGVAQQQPGEDLDALMARADTALYAGKQAGRNRVVLAPAPG